MTVSVYDEVVWGEAEGDTDYITQVLRHEEVELKLNDRIRFWVVFWMWARAALLADIVGGLVFAIVFLTTGGTRAETAFAAAKNGATIGVLTSVAVFFIIFFRSKFNQPIAEWKVLLPDRAQCADSVYTKTKGVIERRGMPLQVKARRMINDLRLNTWASRLILTDGQYTTFVSVFPYGSSLYLGWSMWRRRSGWSLFKRWVSDIFGSLFGMRDLLLQVMLRTERPRAMREAVHFACREGVKVAIAQTLVPISYGFADGELPPVERYQRTEMLAPPIPLAPPSVSIPTAPVPTAPVPTAPTDPAPSAFTMPTAPSPGHDPSPVQQPPQQWRSAFEAASSASEATRSASGGEYSPPTRSDRHDGNGFGSQESGTQPPASPLPRTRPPTQGSAHGGYGTENAWNEQPDPSAEIPPR